MANGIGIINGFDVSNKSPIDKRWGPYSGTTINQCVAAVIDSGSPTYIPEAYRYEGLIVLFKVNNDPIVEYWFKGGVDDLSLQEKNPNLDGSYVSVTGDTMTGNLTISDGGLNVTGDTVINGPFTVNGTTTPILEVSETGDNLLEITDSDGNQIITVSEEEGDALLEVLDTNGTVILSINNDGTLSQSSFSAVGLTTGEINLILISKTSCNALFFDIMVYNIENSGYRAESITSIQDGISLKYISSSTPDLNASTSGVEFDVQIVNTNVVLVAKITSGTFNINVGVRKI